MQRAAVNLSDFRRCKKTRRGQKRRRPQGAVQGKDEKVQPSEDADSPSVWTSQEVSVDEPNDVAVATTVVDDEDDDDDRGSSRLLLRPLRVPMAPNNSTQFIIDDHEDCHLYQSFESPQVRPTVDSQRCRHRTSSSDDDDEEEEDEEADTTSPCYWDIDYEYESPEGDGGLTTAAFLERDFETIYRRAREEELSSLARPELISRLVALEQQLVSSVDATVMVTVGGMRRRREEDLLMTVCQEQLLRLQEENESLRSVNSGLSTAEMSVA